MNAEERDRLYGWHALPPLWWEMPYHEFLVERRVRMADVIRQAWELLTIGPAPAAAVAPVAVADLIAGGETGRSEEHTSELQSLMSISYAGFRLKKKKRTKRARQNI